MPSPIRVGILDTGIGDPVAARRSFTGHSLQDSAQRQGHGILLGRIVRHHCPPARLLDAQAFLPGRASTAAQVAEALDWLVDESAHLINLSFGLREDRQVLAQAVSRASQAGVLLVASIPAQGAPVFPATYSGVIRVTGDARCRSGVFSDLRDIGVHFGAAPGNEVHQAHQPGGGASLAAAHVSGALAYSLSQGASPVRVVEGLWDTCRYRGRECRS